MTYRLYTDEDKKQVDELLKKYNMSLSDETMIYVAEHEGKIIGLTAARPVIEITLISENPLVGYKLINIMENIIKKTRAGIIRAICKPERKELFGRFLYKDAFPGQCVLEKIIQR
jgi:hypothetical protein